MSENKALIRTAPALFSIANSSILKGSKEGTFNSGNPRPKYERKWVNDPLMHLFISGSALRQGRMYSAANKQKENAVIRRSCLISKKFNFELFILRS